MQTFTTVVSSVCLAFVVMRIEKYLTTDKEILRCASQLETMERKITSYTVSLNSFNQSIKDYSSGCASNVSTVNEKLHVVQQHHSSSMENINFKFDRCENDIKNIQGFQKKTNETVSKIRIIEDQQKSNKELQQNQSTYTFFIPLFLLGVGECVVMAVLISALKKLHALKRQLGVEGPRSVNPEHTPCGKTAATSKTQGLANSVAVVGFDDHRERAYRELMRHVTEDLDTKFYLLKRKEDAIQINSKIAVLFVERNNRHIILESPNEAGDLRVSCVRAIQQKGGKVIVIYCGHKESKNIGDHLCSPSLTSADNQQELKSLKNHNCFLSINTTFSDAQKEHLKAKIRECLLQN